MSAGTKLAGLRGLLAFDNRWQLVVNRLVFGESLLVYRLRGLEILVDHEGGDACGTRHCLVSGMYRRLLRHMDLTGGATVLDLGANGGGFPLLLKAEGIDVRRLVCVELNPVTMQRLSFNIARNFGAEARCVNLAVCGRDGEASVELGRGGTADSLRGADPRSAGVAARRVACATVDRICGEHLPDAAIDVCKIDVEGSEYEIFRSPGHDCLGRCRYLVIEIHAAAPADVQALHGEIGRLGFRDITPAGGPDSNVRLFARDAAPPAGAGRG